ncbi:adenine DNA glycosylase-like [Scylla paramamosain]|uniref:adenine DNA glycosylase-like n=1 Tax=Scylla paramamosain TaxID=85552 RepID=UPI003082C255
MGKPKVKPVTSLIGPLHNFTGEEVATLRSHLLAWYDANHRVLPWRTIAATEPNPHRRAYAVWISEIMLQQTQVSTVVSYFEKWMSRWPTVEDLAQATLEEVNQAWSGLGYYSRVRRLHEGAVKVVEKLKGKFPSDRDGLVEELPGVGQYSGSAIASIALGQAVGVVDGNVNRVLARVRGIGMDISAPTTVAHMWALADEIVDAERPGDFNQAMMELGATVCTPKAPKCSSCPLRSLCVAQQRSGCVQQRSSIKNHFQQHKESAEEETSAIPDIECVAGCDFCLQKEDWDESLGVQNYPVKGRKTKQREETTAVVILKCEDGRMLLVQRPKGGLLASLWEFPHIALTEESEEHWEKTVGGQVTELFGVLESDAASRTFIADVTHIFSHIRQTYRVYKIRVASERGVCWPERYQGGQWMTREQFLSSATSTAMKKVLKAVEAQEGKSKDKKSKKSSADQPSKKQKTISQFFSTVAKK